tara:strand:- start:375 stop:1556 length:1182 start_codon:yes stop_codon:yes gene_type:complete
MKILFKGKNKKIIEKKNLIVWRLDEKIYVDHRDYINPLLISTDERFIFINFGFFEDFNDLKESIKFPKSFFLSSGFLPILDKYVVVDPTFNFIFSKKQILITKKKILSYPYHSFFSKLNELIYNDNIKLALSDGMDSSVLKSLLNKLSCVSIVNSLRIKLKLKILYRFSKIKFLKINFYDFVDKTLLKINNLTWSVPNIIDFFLIEKCSKLVIGHTGDFLRNGHYYGDSSMKFILSKYFRNYELDEHSKLYIVNYISNYFNSFENNIDHSLKVQSFGYIHRQLPFLIGSLNHAKFINKKLYMPFWNFDFAYFFLSKNVSEIRKNLFNDFYKSVLGSKYYMFKILNKIQNIEYKFFLFCNKTYIYQDTFRFRKFNKLGLTKYIIKSYERIYTKR